MWNFFNSLFFPLRCRLRSFFNSMSGLSWCRVFGVATFGYVLLLFSFSVAAYRHAPCIYLFGFLIFINYTSLSIWFVVCWTAAAVAAAKCIFNAIYTGEKLRKCIRWTFRGGKRMRHKHKHRKTKVLKRRLIRIAEPGLCVRVWCCVSGSEECCSIYCICMPCRAVDVGWMDFRHQCGNQKMRTNKITGKHINLHERNEIQAFTSSIVINDR